MPNSSPTRRASDRRTITTETAKAAEQASVQTKERVESENRGFFHFGSDDPIESRITGTFAGFRKGNTYTLDNGQQWRQTDTASLAGVRVENPRSEEHTSELQSLMRISYAVFCLKTKHKHQKQPTHNKTK